MSTSIRSIAVIGAGTMGSGISLVAAQSGTDCWQIDISAEQLERAKAYHAKTVARAVSKQRMTEEEGTAALARIRYTQSMADGRNAEWAVEAASENVDVKKKIFVAMQSTFSASTVLATNK
ncbi:MAG: 3-hydroxyacyl-CoA dehydrogenase NAD-binding domain-containing protein [Planctomycetota bacterium]|nr:3-hydroxyacyl-CoA dehydrogenase NAD-binding domain-containing protein [Planctomycetota bacterium]